MVWDEEDSHGLQMTGVSNGLCEHTSTTVFLICEQRALCKKKTFTKTEHASTCKNVRIRANEHGLNVCEQFEQKPNFART